MKSISLLVSYAALSLTTACGSAGSTPQQDTATALRQDTAAVSDADSGAFIW